MATVKSTVTVDVHFTEDVEADAIRSVMRTDTRGIDPTLKDDLLHVFSRGIEDAIDASVDGEVNVRVDLALIDDRIPGVPRERLQGEIEFEGDDTAIAGVDNAVDPPTRAEIAEDASARVRRFLSERGIEGDVDVTVSLTPVAFE